MINRINDTGSELLRRGEMLQLTFYKSEEAIEAHYEIHGCIGGSEDDSDGELSCSDAKLIRDLIEQFSRRPCP